MNPLGIILFLTCVNRLYRLAFFENYRHEKEISNFGFTASGISIVYLVIWAITNIAIQIFVLFSNLFLHLREMYSSDFGPLLHFLDLI